MPQISEQQTNTSAADLESLDIEHPSNTQARVETALTDGQTGQAAGLASNGEHADATETAAEGLNEEEGRNNNGSDEDMERSSDYIPPTEETPKHSRRQREATPPQNETAIDQENMGPGITPPAKTRRMSLRGNRTDDGNGKV